MDGWPAGYDGWLAGCDGSRATIHHGWMDGSHHKKGALGSGMEAPAPGALPFFCCMAERYLLLTSMSAYETLCGDVVDFETLMWLIGT